MALASKQLQVDTLKTLRDLYRQILFLAPEDEIAFEFAPCILLSHFLSPGMELCWGYLCAPASGGKTEVLTMFRGVTDLAIFRDDISANALNSGYDSNGRRTRARAKPQNEPEATAIDPSLLKELDHRCLIIHDFSALFADEKAIAGIFRTLRSAYSGQSTRHTGTLGTSAYSAHFSVLGGVTSGAMDEAMRLTQAAGERFVALRIQSTAQPVADAVAVSARSVSYLHHKDGLRTRLQEQATAALLLGKRQMQLGLLPVPAAHPFYARLGRLAFYLANLRTGPRTNREFACIPAAAEHPQRLFQVFVWLSHARARLSGRNLWDESDMRFVERIARDTLHSVTSLLLSALAAPSATGSGHPIPELEKALWGLNGHYVTHQLGQWAHSQLLRCTQKRWAFTDDALHDLLDLNLLPATVAARLNGPQNAPFTMRRLPSKIRKAKK